MEYSMNYNPANDRSEECGWKKVCDEHVPTEAEQLFWSKVWGVTAVALIALAVMFPPVSRVL